MMPESDSACSKWSIFAFALAAVVVFSIPMHGQEGAQAANGVGVIDDWTHHHVMFSNPGTEEDAIKSGRYQQWQRIVNDPRYKLQQLKRTAGPAATGTEVVPVLNGPIDWRRAPVLPNRRYKNPAPPPITKDWSQPLGGVNTTLTSNLATTLSASNIGSSSSLTVNIKGTNYTLTASAPTPLTVSGTFSAAPTAGQWVTITNGTANTLTLTVVASGTNGCTSATTGTFVAGANGTAAASNLATAITSCNNLNSVVGVTASASNAEITASADIPGSTGGNNLFFNTNITVIGDYSETAGTDGVTTNTNTATPTFAYWYGNTYVSAATVATNIYTALSAVTGISTYVTVTNPAAGEVEFALKSGTGPYTVSTANFTAFAPVGSVGSSVAATVQPNVFPAKYGLSLASLSTASCSDFVVYPTGQEGSGSAATIIAYTNLYSSCSGTVPTVAWAYNTGTGYAVTTSPTLSEDGTEVIFAQSNGSTAELVVLKPGTGGTISAPSTTLNTSTNIATCAAPCIASVSLGANDTYSAPYYTYEGNQPGNVGADMVFVGTDSGTLLKITPVLDGALGTPASTTLTSNVKAASPAYDTTSGCVFVGDIDGYVYSVNSGISGGTVCTGAFGGVKVSEQLGVAGAGIFDGPLIDSTAETVYVFIGEAAGAVCGTGTTDDNCVTEFTASAIANEGTTAAAPAHKEPLGGASGVANPIYSGSFDNIYYNSANSAGNLYVVGGTGSTAAASLYQVAIATGGVMSAAASVATVTSGAEYPWPSLLSEFYNTSAGVDYAFFSVYRAAAGLGCTNTAGNGCILSYNITKPTAVTQSGTGQTLPTPTGNGCWATSAISIDNSATTAGASQIYFVDLNGVAAGGAGGGTAAQTSSNCTAGTADATLQGVQAAQSNP